MSNSKEFMATFSAYMTMILLCLSIPGVHATLYEIKHRSGKIFYLKTIDAPDKPSPSLNTDYMEKLFQAQVRRLENASAIGSSHQILTLTGGMAPRENHAALDLIRNLVLGLSWIFTALHIPGFDRILMPEPSLTHANHHRLFVTIETSEPEKLESIMRTAANLADSLVSNGTLNSWHPQLTSIERIGQRRIMLSLTGQDTMSGDTFFYASSALSHALDLFTQAFPQERVSYHEHYNPRNSWQPPIAPTIVNKPRQVMSAASGTLSSGTIISGATTTTTPETSATAHETYANRINRELHSLNLDSISYNPYKQEILSWQQPERFIISFWFLARDPGLASTRAMLINLSNHLRVQRHIFRLDLRNIQELDSNLGGSDFGQADYLEVNLELTNYIPGSDVPNLQRTDFAINTLLLQDASESENVAIQAWTTIQLQSYTYIILEDDDDDTSLRPTIPEYATHNLMQQQRLLDPEATQHISPSP